MFARDFDAALRLLKKAGFKAILGVTRHQQHLMPLM